MQVKLTVFFESPFWVGVFERSHEGAYEVARVVFGAEPSTTELLAFIRSHYPQRIPYRASEGHEPMQAVRPRNPKRAEREARREMARPSLSTKAQDALRLVREAQKTERKVKSREERLAEDERKCELRQAKRKARHRGH